MRLLRPIGCLLLLVALAGAPAAAGWLSHPPMRPLPQPSARPAAGGTARFVDAARGDDGWEGSEARPWRSLRHATRRLAAGDTLYLRGGVYYERLVLRLSGEPGRPVTLRSYPGELAILDGGLRDFFEQPGAAWAPFAEGAPGEYRSVKVYPGLAEAQGLFGDSMVPLHAYRNLDDLRAENETWVDHETATYCGPGIWFDVWSGRLHARLAPVRLAALREEDRYRGEGDPRKLALVISGGQSVPLWIEGARHLRLQDLVVRGAGAAAVRLLDVEDLELDNVTLYSGRRGIEMNRADRVRIVGSALRGTAAPWSFRTSHKYRGIPSTLFLTAGAWRKSRDLEVSHSEFTDGHDGVFLGELEGARFHHNLVENFNDDGIFLTSRGSGPRGVHIFQNRLARLLTTFAFGWGRGKSNRPGDGVWIYRNLVELMEPVHYIPPGPGRPAEQRAYGRVASDHGSPIWEPATIYHNTFVARQGDKRWYALGWAGHTAGSRRRLFNNLFVQVEGMPGRFPPATEDFVADGNLSWSVEAGPRLGTGFFASFRESVLFAASKERYPPGWEAHGLFADPRFVRFDAAGPPPHDLRLAPGSPALDAGVALAAAWPDPLRDADAGRPDIGALPAGAEVPGVGREALPR